MMKYLVFVHPQFGNQQIHIFDKNERHKDVGHALLHSFYKGWKIERGGLVMFIEGQLKCGGEAFSLGLRSDPEKDTALLLRCFEV